jgi:hypothetical protein
MFVLILRRMARHWRSARIMEEKGLNSDFEHGHYIALKNIVRDLTSMDWDSIESLMRRSC